MSENEIQVSWCETVRSTMCSFCVTSTQRSRVVCLLVFVLSFDTSGVSDFLLNSFRYFLCVRIFWAVVSNFVQPESIVFYAWFSGLLSNENLHNMTSFFKWSRCFITLEHRYFLRAHEQALGEVAFCFASSPVSSPHSFESEKASGFWGSFFPLKYGIFYD